MQGTESMIAADVMTKHLLSVTPDSSVDDAASLLLQHRISGLLVVDGAGDLAGIVTEGDMLRRCELGTSRERSWWQQVLASPTRQAADFTRAHGRKVSDIMTSSVVSVAHDAGLGAVVDLMEQHGIKRLPVTQDSKVVGVVSRADLLKALLAHASEGSLASGDEQSAGGSDDEIRAAILAEVERQPWAPTMTVRVTVADGVADIEGAVTSEEERRAIGVLAENTKGVRAVRDKLVIVEPQTGTVIEAPDERT